MQRFRRGQHGGMTSRFAATLAALCILCPSAAIADNQTVDVQVMRQASSPIQIQQCEVRYVHTVTPVAGTPTNTVTAVAYLSYEDGDTQNAVAVKFGFTFKDSFGETLYTAYGENTGTYSPGALISPNLNLAGYPRPGSPGAFSVTFAATSFDELDCFVAAVRRADGSVWRYDAVPSSSSAAQTNNQGVLTKPCRYDAISKAYKC